MSQDLFSTALCNRIVGPIGPGSIWLAIFGLWDNVGTLEAMLIQHQNWCWWLITVPLSI